MIRLDDVHVNYKYVKALQGVSCEIQSGAVGLLGPNGAGKSTLIKTLLGFNRASAGSVSVFGYDMPENRLEVRAQLGYMPENEVVSPKVSAVSFLTYAGCLCGMRRTDAMERAHEVLNYVGMGDNRYRKMETYSTGMLQRVKFGQALIHDPKLLLLDEPTNGLDPQGRLEMLELIKELSQKRGVTVLLSSHLLPDVAHVCDRVVIINKGKITRDGLISELTTLREGQYEIRVRDAKEQYLARLTELGFACIEQQNGNILVTKPEEVEERVLFEAARDCGTQVRHFEPLRHSLEEIFMQAIRGAEHAHF